MRASVVPGCNAPPVFELGEAILDLVALAIECHVVGISDFPTWLYGMQGSMPLFRKPRGMARCHNRDSQSGIWQTRSGHCPDSYQRKPRQIYMRTLNGNTKRRKGLRG